MSKIISLGNLPEVKTFAISQVLTIQRKKHLKILEHTFVISGHKCPPQLRRLLFIVKISFIIMVGDMWSVPKLYWFDIKS